MDQERKPPMDKTPETVESIEEAAEFVIRDLAEEVEFQREARRMAEQSQPEQEMYFMVKGTNHIVKSHEELNRLMKKKVQFEYVSYNRAMNAIFSEEALIRQSKKKKQKRKQVKQARRRNRGR